MARDRYPVGSQGSTDARAVAGAAVAVLTMSAVLAGPAMGQGVPLPPPRPTAETTVPPPPASEVPLPRPRPDDSEAPAAAAPQAAVPEDKACDELGAGEGVALETLPVMADGACGIPRPVRISMLPGHVALAPPAVSNCAVGLALAGWLRDAADPAARQMLGTQIKGLDLATSYECRSQNRQPGAKLSEHAFGNGVDVAAFRLADGRRVVVGEGDGPTAAFVDAARAGACRTFTTVLGPGSDEAHGNHLHLDLRGRNGGYRICQ